MATSTEDPTHIIRNKTFECVIKCLGELQTLKQMKKTRVTTEELKKWGINLTCWTLHPENTQQSKLKFLEPFPSAQLDNLLEKYQSLQVENYPHPDIQNPRSQADAIGSILTRYTYATVDEKQDEPCYLLCHTQWMQRK